MNRLINIIVVLTLISCGFNGTHTDQVELKEELPFVINDNDDSDGDLVINIEEKNQGRNPLVADIPKLNVKFLQDYKITIKAKSLESGKEESYDINTKVGKDRYNFKYRVGDLFIRELSKKEAARIARYSNHSHSNIDPYNFTWISYPKVDPKFYLEHVHRISKYFNKELYEIIRIDIEFESSVKLKSNGVYSQIKNLSANFYYYDYEKEKYSLIKNHVLERNLNEGVNEKFKVKIENVPHNLIYENYLKKGEFIISEVADFEIPLVKSNCSQLMKSVKEKSIALAYNTPLNNEIKYVGLDSKKRSLSQILKASFGNNFEIKNNQIQKIDQFENNLPTYKNLSELGSHVKKGKWFVLTSNLNKSLLDYSFSNEDYISLTYMLGSDLSKKSQEKIYSFTESKKSEDTLLTPIGNITPNSKVAIFLYPLKIKGKKLSNKKNSISAGGRCGKNCLPREYTCDFSVNIFSDYDSRFVFLDDNKYVDRFSLVINNDQEFLLSDLLKENKVELSRNGKSLYLEIKDVSKLISLVDGLEYILSLKVRRISANNFSGIKLVKASGKDYFTCFGLTTNIAGSNNWPLSPESHDFSQWESHVNWKRVKRGQRITYYQDIEVGISSVINNFFN